jgi:hypothetical protein
LNVVKMPKEMTQVERVLELLGQDVSLGAWLKSNLGIDLGWLKPYVTQHNLMNSGTHSSVYNADLEALR